MIFKGKVVHGHSIRKICKPKNLQAKKSAWRKVCTKRKLHMGTLLEVSAPQKVRTLKSRHIEKSAHRKVCWYLLIWVLIRARSAFFADSSHYQREISVFSLIRVVISARSAFFCWFAQIRSEKNFCTSVQIPHFLVVAIELEFWNFAHAFLASIPICMHGFIMIRILLLPFAYVLKILKLFLYSFRFKELGARNSTRR